MLFDLVLFAAFFEPLPATAVLEEELRAAIAGQPTELALDTVTRVTRERQFRAEVQHLSGVADRRALGTALAAIAEAAIRVTRDLAIADMQRRHGTIKGDLAVLAMGRLGLGDLTATSDLDLVFVWDAPAGAASTGIEDGRRTLGASSYFTRLAQTLANWLGGATGEGKLFTIDLRLRPDGEKSGLAPSLARLTAYYRDEAWLWEKLALGKARLVTPAATCGAAVIDSLAQIRTTALPVDIIASPLHDMRRRLRASYGDAQEWQLRKHPGGIGELDLLIQALRLRNADLFGNAAWRADAILDRIVESGRLAPEHGEALGAAESLYADLHHALRFVVGTSATDPQALSAAARQFICAACDSPDLETLRGRVDSHRGVVEALFDRLFPAPPG
jgi:glutamate-ammonia-ligase adenylyltransferase